MKKFDTDVLIVGSGLVGLVAAHCLSSLKYNVNIVDKNNFLRPNLSFNDTRTVAVSEGSKNFLETLSIWSLLRPHAHPIKSIKVYDRSYTNKIYFKNQIKNKKLGYIIENRIFSNVLINELSKLKNVNLRFDFDLKGINVEKTNIQAYFKNNIINSQLLIAADGKNSNIRKLAGNKIFKKNYSESALVLNFLHEKKLKNTAYEIFYKSGPLAILPVNSKNGLFQSTIIWSNNITVLNKLKACDNNFIKYFMEEKIGEIVGRISEIISLQIFPLSAHINDNFYSKRLVYVGDSAHSIHPIAGQGWNLGVSDVKNLYNIARKSEIKIGSDLFCKTYNEKTYHKAFQLFQITDKLNGHFKSTGRLYRFCSNIGFDFIEKNQLIKNKITKYAMGLN